MSTAHIAAADPVRKTIPLVDRHDLKATCTWSLAANVRAIAPLVQTNKTNQPLFLADVRLASG
jgi:hypothetical protein